MEIKTMKTRKNVYQLWPGIILVLVISVVQATETPPLQWNGMAESQIMDNNELAKLGSVFPTWKIKQITWPSSSKINSNKVIVDPNLVVSCMGWLTKFMSKEQLPANLDKNLIAMKDFGLITKESEQKRLCDVFIARFKKGPYVIHIQESPCNIVIAMADERLVSDPRIDHKNLVIEMATLILNGTLKPNPDSEDLHVFELVRDNQKISRVSWLIESAATLKNGRKVIDDAKSCEIGASHVEAETNGRFVKFDIPKVIKGPRECPDCYVKRF
jgi:hypothetical protein